MSHTALICLGSNVLECECKIASALDGIRNFASVRANKHGYTSADITGKGRPYLNLAAICETELDKADFIEHLAMLEKCGGRTPESKSTGIMPLDIDLVTWDEETISPNDLNAAYFKILIEELQQ